MMFSRLSQWSLRIPLCLLLVGLSRSMIYAQDSGQRAVPEAPVILDVQHYDIRAEITPEESTIKGEAQIRFVVREQTVNLPFEINKRLTIIDVVDEADVQYSLSFDDYDSTRMRVRAPETLEPGAEKTIKVRFEGMLEREEYPFLDAPQTEPAVIEPDRAVLLTEGRWFPMHSLPLDAATLRFQITVPLGFSVVAPGELESIETLGINEVFTWRADESVTQVPVVVARFFRQEFKSQPVPLTFFVTEDFEQDLEPFVETVSALLQFYQDEYGTIPIDHLNLVQVGNVQLGSTGSRGLVLLESKMVDNPSLPLMEMARRIARQWWGYSVRFERSADAWLQDGFSTYAALLFLQDKHPDQLETELARQAVLALKYESKAPISKGLELGIGSGEYDSIVASKGAWVLYMLAQLSGQDQFNALMRDWYRQNAQQSVNTGTFARFVQQRTVEDYQWFFVQWVDSVGVPEFRVEYTIYKVREGSFKIRGQIRQNLDLFRMPMDVLIETKGQPESKQLFVNGKATPFTFDTETMPLRIVTDPSGKILHESGRMRVMVHVALGEEYQAQTEFIAAIREFEKAKELDPRSSLAHFRLGEVYFEQQNLSSAANSFRDTLNGDLKPEWVETWSHIYLGKIYDVLGQRQRALAEYQKAINTKNDYNGAQQEAEKYLKEPFSRPRTLLGG